MDIQRYRRPRPGGLTPIIPHPFGQQSMPRLQAQSRPPFQTRFQSMNRSCVIPGLPKPEDLRPNNRSGIMGGNNKPPSGGHQWNPNNPAPNPAIYREKPIFFPNFHQSEENPVAFSANNNFPKISHNDSYGRPGPGGNVWQQPVAMNAPFVNEPEPYSSWIGDEDDDYYGERKSYKEDFDDEFGFEDVAEQPPVIQNNPTNNKRVIQQKNPVAPPSKRKITPEDSKVAQRMPCGIKSIAVTANTIKALTKNPSIPNVLYELFGFVSSVCTNAKGIHFNLTSGSAAVPCVFHEVDRKLPTLSRNQRYRCVGYLNENGKILTVSVRPSTSDEIRYSSTLTVAKLQNEP